MPTARGASSAPIGSEMVLAAVYKWDFSLVFNYAHFWIKGLGVTLGELGQTMAEYAVVLGVITLAVVDTHERLSGIITADDVITMLRHKH